MCVCMYGQVMCTVHVCLCVYVWSSDVYCTCVCVCMYGQVMCTVHVCVCVCMYASVRVYCIYIQIMLLFNFC